MDFMKNRTKILTAVIGLTLFSNVNAAIINADLNELDDGLAFIDTDQGLEFVDLTQTIRHSMEYTRTLLEPGRKFEGFRIANHQEISSFMTNLEQTLSGDLRATSLYDDGGYMSSNNSTTDYGIVINYLKNVTGVTARLGANVLFSSGYYYDNDTDRVMAADLFIDTSNKYNRLQYGTGDYDPNSGANGSGIWLVSGGGNTLSSRNDESLVANNPNNAAVDVPEPSTLFLSLMGALGLIARKRIRT